MLDFDQQVQRFGTWSLKWQCAKESAVALGLADMDFLPPSCVRNAIRVLAANEVLGYCGEPRDVVAAVREWQYRRFEVSIAADEVVLVSGVMSALRAIIEEFSRPGESIVVQNPAYNMSFAAIEQAEREVLYNPLRRDDEGRWLIDFDHLESILRRHKPPLMIFCSPHNPTGRVRSAEEIGRVAQLCRDAKTILCVDEIFCDWVHEPWRFSPTATQEIGADVILQATTKTFNVPGLRGGHAFIRAPELRKRLLARSARHGVNKTNLAYLVASKAAYCQGAEWLDGARLYVRENLRLVAEELGPLPVVASCVAPEATYLLRVQLKRESLFEQQLVAAIADEVSFSPGAILRGQTSAAFRLNCATSQTELLRAVRALRNKLAHLA